MFKFLIYLFLIYLVYRIIFGRTMGGILKTKVYRFDKDQHESSKPKEPEGSITVNPKINKEKLTGNSPKIGEYVDYEEIK